jgi:hemerythrin
MAVIEWNSKYETGDRLVDTQHQSLFRLINDLHATNAAGRSREVVAEVLASLHRYVGKHFAAEERLMQKSAYPQMARHVALHNALAEKSQELVDNFSEGKLVLGVTVFQFLSNWLTEHILVEDRKMIDWVRVHGAFGASSGSFETENATAGDYGGANQAANRSSQSRLKEAQARVRESVQKMAVASASKPKKP